MAKQFDCSSQSTNYTASSRSTEYPTAAAKPAIVLVNISQSCTELSKTLQQYQNSGVPLLDPSNNTMQKMDGEMAQRVIQRVTTQLSRKCR